MRYLHSADPRFRTGLAQHGFPDDYGLRLLNSGFDPAPFGARWGDAPALREAAASGRPFYIDRITGGMPFQSLDGIGDIADRYSNDQNFLGFQVHEWDNSPLFDHRRVTSLLLDQGLPFDEAHFAQYAGRTSLPYFSGGDYAMYRDLHPPLETMREVEEYLTAYFSRLVELTAGQILSVNGNASFFDTALRLGAKHIIAEVGNQIPLTALQLAYLRGTAKVWERPFGAYYETWGGSPFGCTCATDFSPWFATPEQLRTFHEMGSVGPQHGSSRSLQRRLLYFAWLAGAAWWAEEWGPENYFTNWDDYPLTDYGRINRDFARVSAPFGPVTPIVPAALVLPPGTFGLDTAWLAGARDRVFRIGAPDATHQRLRNFTQQLFTPQPHTEGRDAQTLTPSPWIGCFDLLPADVSPAQLSAYAVVCYLDPAQARQSEATVPVFTLDDGMVPPEGLQLIRDALPFRVTGEVGCIQAHTAQGVLVGLFNNLGITKTAEGETADPAASCPVTLSGPHGDITPLVGGEYLRRVTAEGITLELPAGAVVVLLSAR